MMIFPGEYIYSTDMMGVICRENLFSICMELHVKNIKIKMLREVLPVGDTFVL